jgi:acetyl esterase
LLCSATSIVNVIEGVPIRRMLRGIVKRWHQIADMVRRNGMLFFRTEENLPLTSKLDPQVKALLDQFQASSAHQPAPHRALSADEAVVETRQSTATFAALGIPAEPVARIDELELPGPAGIIPTRLYVPDTITTSAAFAPVFVYFHGGGFVAGDLEVYDTLLRALANRGGCIVVAVAYRLAPENPYPAGNDDAWAALKWVADHASEIGADPRRLAVGGDSAGGLLAAWVAQKAKANGPALRLQALLYPNLDATTSKPSWKALGTGAYPVSHALMRALYDAYLPRRIDREDPKVSPLFATDLTGLAPALIVTADHDPLHDEGDEYASKLKAANVSVDHICWPGMIHGFASLAGVLDAGKLLIDRMGAALRQAFEEDTL